MKLLDFVCTNALISDLQATERDAAINEVLDKLVETGTVPADLKDELVSMIIERENHGSTGFGKGVAVPHVKHERITKMQAAVGVSQKGVDFNALDKQPVYSIFMLLSPKDSPDEHLQAMENIFSNLQKDQFRRFLRQSTSADEIKDLLNEADTQQLPG
ncbi:PTS system fructose-specific EIIABC component [Poriferisphaera corsica]|uniref:PTS system fructose-specific EIIABC component n=1 Tax=Poriferisphaera corsica TaxID=2528020 RepID=A0A517YRQ0_9BACT|nr:PTS sugar transporter subunit IIA [Poriferisphaera corsica]QDU32902.1 PTS system fructose-specific EIIABC component [Poriferisphaera corsica]